MRYRFLLIVGMLVPAGFGLAQQRDVGEVRDTLRFLRLAETKKQLSLSEEKLLRVNEIFDRFEEVKFKLKAQERNLRRQIAGGDAGSDGAERLMNALSDLRRDNYQNETETWLELRKILTPPEALQLFVFYEKFQRDVQRRIHMLRENRRMKRRSPMP